MSQCKPQHLKRERDWEGQLDLLSLSFLVPLILVSYKFSHSPDLNLQAQFLISYYYCHKTFINNKKKLPKIVADVQHNNN